MKLILALPAVLFALATALHGAVTLNLTVGVVNDASGTPIVSSSNLLWALIADTNNDDQLPGGLGLNESLTSANVNATFLAFSGQTIAVDNTIGGDTIFAVGQGTGPFGEAASAVEVDLVARGLTVGQDFAFYWFPGHSLADALLDESSFEIGGVHEVAQPNGGFGTIIPPDTTAPSINIQTTALFGPLPTTRMDAITVPEPSSALLALLGLGLLRRRR